MLDIVNAVSPSMELVHVLFDMGADPISFVNREHDDDDSKTMGIVALAGTTMISSTYGL